MTKNVYTKIQSRTMDARAFFYLVSQMRQAQRDYFSNRSPERLRYARALEGDVDREIARVKSILNENSW